MSLLPTPSGLVDSATEEVISKKKKDFKRPARPIGVDKLSAYDDMDKRVVITIKDYVASLSPRAHIRVAKDLSKKYGSDVGVVYIINEVGEAALLFVGGLAVKMPYIIFASPLINSEPFVLGSYKALKKWGKESYKKATKIFKRGKKKSGMQLINH